MHTDGCMDVLHVCIAGLWDYVGGETRLLGGLDPDCVSYAALSQRVEDEVRIKLGSEVRLSILLFLCHIPVPHSCDPCPRSMPV